MGNLLLTLGEHRVPLPPEGRLLIGSGTSADVQIEAEGIAARHAMFTRDASGRWFVRDLGSSQGTFLGDRRIRREKIAAGDEVRFGPVSARIEAEPGTEEESVGSPVAPPSVADEAPAAAAETQAVSPPPQAATSFSHLRAAVWTLAGGAAAFAAATWINQERLRELDVRLATLDLEVREAARARPQLPPPAPAPSSPTLPPEAAALLSRLEPLLAQSEILEKKIEEAGKRSAAADRQLAQAENRIKEIASSLRKKNGDPPPPAAGTTTPLLPSDLVLLKERNRLTGYADEAIATGSRGAYERLWDAIADPRMATLSYAARAEILRVQECFLNGQRVRAFGIQQHRIPVAEIFPDSKQLAPEQLSDDQLIHVLLDPKLEWATRVKAAWHLGQHRNAKVADALVKAIQSDPSLDVVAEATFSFSQITGYQPRLFETQALEEWWQSRQGQLPAPPAPSAAKAPAANPPADPASAPAAAQTPAPASAPTPAPAPATPPAPASDPAPAATQPTATAPKDSAP